MAVCSSKPEGRASRGAPAASIISHVLDSGARTEPGDTYAPIGIRLHHRFSNPGFLIARTAGGKYY
jgi:hypothetical protein